MKAAAPPSILLIGYGNPGRQDDGLGPAFADAVATLRLPHVTVETAWQLDVEYAVRLREHAITIFADAAQRDPAPFTFKPVRPAASVPFSTHHLPPNALVALARTLFPQRPRAYVLGIRGYQFGVFQEGLTAAAARNMQAALDYLTPFLRNGRRSSAGFKAR